MTASAAQTMTGALHYRGDQRSIVGNALGPTHYGMLVTAIVADYNETTDTTTVVCAPGDVRTPEARQEVMARIQATIRVQEFFDGARP